MPLLMRSTSLIKHSRERTGSVHIILSQVCYNDKGESLVIWGRLPGGKTESDLMLT